MLNNLAWNGDCRTAYIDRSQLGGLWPCWQRLAARSLEDNVNYSPEYSRALLESVATKTKMGFATAWEGDRLIALLPVRPIFDGPSLLKYWTAWVTPFTSSCMPLLDRERPHHGAVALATALRQINPGIWMLPFLDRNAMSTGMLLEALSRLGASCHTTREFRRAVFDRNIDFESHLKNGVSSKRRRDLNRNRRRLEQLGPVTHEVHTRGKGLSDAVDAFLRIESRGWKGELGTALACSADTREFAMKAFKQPHAAGAARADVLCLSGNPIAVGLMLFSGRTGFTVKGTYDEEYRGYSVGLVLEIEVLRSFLSQDWADRLDSATAGAHVIDALWPDRIDIADHIFSFSPLPDFLPALLAKGLQARKAAKTRAKKIIGRR